MKLITSRIIIISIIICGALIFMFLGIKNKDKTALSIPNPMTKASPELLINQLGVNFLVPQGAENVSYHIIADKIAQMSFTINDSEVTARIQPSNQFEDISGMYYNWSFQEDCNIGWCQGRLFLTTSDKKNIGLCLWYDVVPGLMYSLSIDSNATKEQLIQLAQAVYKPAQGDS